MLCLRRLGSFAWVLCCCGTLLTVRLACSQVRDIIAAGFSIRSRQTGAKRDGDTDAASSGAAGAAPGSSLQKLEERLTHLERAMLRVSDHCAVVATSLCLCRGIGSGRVGSEVTTGLRRPRVRCQGPSKMCVQLCVRPASIERCRLS